jgi:hypothetical protein
VAIPYLAPWAPPLALAMSGIGSMRFLAPAAMGGLPYLAPPELLVAAPAVASGSFVFFAPATIDGLPYLAPPRVPVTLILPQAVVGGRGVARRATSGIKSSPAPAATRYHSHSYEQEELAAAAELDDEETVLALIMEIALHV